MRTRRYSDPPPLGVSLVTANIVVHVSRNASEIHDLLDHANIGALIYVTNDTTDEFLALQGHHAATTASSGRSSQSQGTL